MGIIKANVFEPCTPYAFDDNVILDYTSYFTNDVMLLKENEYKILNELVTNLLNKPEERSKYAIDRFWFILQNISNWYLITPLTVVQREDYSDIEGKLINYQKMMQDLDKDEIFKMLRERNN